jgi:hypothetical protein
MKQLQHTSVTAETLAKPPEQRLKAIANIYNIKIKHLQHAYETPETL